MRAFNLLPPEQRAVTEVVRERPSLVGHAVVAVLALVLVGAFLHVRAANDVAEGQVAATAAERDLVTLQAQAAALAPARDRAAAVESHLQTIRTLAGGRYAWDRALVDLARTLPSTTHLSAVETSTTTAGAGGSAVRGALNVPAAVLRGCTERQSQIPDLLSRLRDMRGATRVVLGSSLSAEGKKDAESGCRSAKAPTFEITVFLTAPGGSANAAVDPSATPVPAATVAPGATS